MKRLFTLFAFLITVGAFAQTVTHGPIVGGVSPSSCRVFVRTSAATNFTVELSTTPAFSTIAASASSSTDAAKDTIAIADVTGLSSDTKYYVRVMINGNPSGDVASFETFQNPATAAHQVFVGGSCIYDLTSADSALFVRARADNPKAFIQMGDWGYPDADEGWFDIYFTNPPTTWAKTYSKVQDIYKERYVSPSHSNFLKQQAVDYVYDDHDYMNDAAGKDGASGFVINAFQGKPLGAPENWDMPAQGRDNSLLGYHNWFPGYSLVDSTEGLYHSFRSGNVEFFVLDLRSMRTPQALSINYINNQWTYTPPAGYTLLGSNQLNWLFNGLQNSTATWKILVSSDAYNLGGRLAYDTLLFKIGNGNVPYWAPDVNGITLPNKGYTAVQNFADNWSGYREEADSLLHFVMNNNISNVFFISADSHTVGLDDGTNSGIPELNSGNLAKANSQDWLIYQKFMGFNMWNKGGSGLCDRDNFGSTYARVEVFNNDSMRLSAVDASGAEVVGYTFMANTPYKYNPLYHADRLPVAANDAVSMIENDTTTITVLTNDTDPENEPLYVNIKSGPSHGTATMDNNNVITYIPAANYVGTDTIYYRACDNFNATCPNCSNAVAVINVAQETGIRNFDARYFAKVFPDPADDVLKVQTNVDKETLRIELVNTLGQKVITQSFTTNAGLNVKHLAAGDYIYTIKGEKSGLLKSGHVNILH
ncbi:MAG: alkaline phosphatase D family protein [Chitinophagales bacterium]